MAGARGAAAGAALALLLTAGAARGQTVFDQVPATVPGYDTRFGLPLLARAEQRLREMGLVVEGVAVRPAVEAGAGFDSDVRGARGTRGSPVGMLDASVLATARVEEVEIVGAAGVADRRYLDAPAQNRTNWHAVLGAAVPLAGGTLRLGAAYLSLHQERTDLDALPTDRPIGYRVADLRASHAYRFNRLTVVPNVEFTLYRFGNATILGVPARQDFRDRTVLAGGVSGRYEIAPGHGALFALRVLSARYLNPAPGAPSRNSVGLAALAGIDFTGAGVWRYSVLAGLEGRQFAARGFRERVIPVVDAQANWQPSGMTSLSARLTRAFEDSAREAPVNTVATRIRLGIEHEYLRDVLLHGYVGAQIAEHEGPAGTRVSFNAGARVTWLVNRHVRLSLSYDLARWSEGILNAAPHEATRFRNLVLASVRLVP